MYIELHQSERIVVLEANSSIGGVWAEDRLYPQLRTNCMLGMYEYPDFPMNETYGVHPGEHMPGAVMHRYLTDYAKRFGIFERTKFNTKVTSIEATVDGEWMLKISSPSSRDVDLRTKKLILATGLTSQPHIPVLPRMQDFRGTVFHAKDFAKQEQTLRTAKNVVVIGGAKSAFDTAYAYAAVGAQVDMVIRKSGHGPALILPAYVTPFKKWLEKLIHTRFLTWMSPCIWGAEDGYSGIRSFLHSNIFGRALVDIFWRILSGDVHSLNKYDSHPELKKLKPWNSAFWAGSQIGVNNYPTNFFDLVKSGEIRVHVDEVSGFGSHAIRLESGQQLKADVVVLSTGWKKEPMLDFFDEAGAEIGPQRAPPTLEALTKDADREILRRLPNLKAPPGRKTQLAAAMTARLGKPLRLYRFMVPPATIPRRNIAFAGMTSSASTPMVAYIQGLWISAYFDGALSRLPSSQPRSNGRQSSTRNSASGGIRMDMVPASRILFLTRSHISTCF
jgi:cation diffusion facilitator CzcD-associated flavoprotein CzcO